MSGTITTEENLYLRGLKRNGKLLKFSVAQFKGIAKNGGVAIICSDGDIDARRFHEQISHRPHCIQLFGGPLLFAPLYGGYLERFAYSLAKNIRSGMEGKSTRTLFLYYHAPCLMAGVHKHSIEDVIYRLAPEVREVFCQDEFFVPKKIFSFLHVKRINMGGKEEQNTYLIAMKA